MQKVTDIQKVKADLAGQYATRLSVVLTSLDIYVHLACQTAHMVGYENHNGRFLDCPQKDCVKTRHLIENSRQLISQGV